MFDGEVAQKVQGKGELPELNQEDLVVYIILTQAATMIQRAYRKHLSSRKAGEEQYKQNLHRQLEADLKALGSDNQNPDLAQKIYQAAEEYQQLNQHMQSHGSQMSSSSSARPMKTLQA
jgi:hypothetical protein